MSLREFLLLLLMCLSWGTHFTVLKFTFGGPADPLFYAAIRMSIVAVLLLPFLKIHKGQMRRILIAGALLGGVNYFFLFTGINNANASVSALTVELFAPVAMVFSVIFLKERVGLPRVLGLMIAFLGVALISTARGVDGMGPAPLLGISLIVCNVFVEAGGAVILKKVRAVKPFELLSWFSLMGALVLWTATAVFEQDQFAVFEQKEQARQFGLAVAYSVVFGSLVGQAIYYWLINRLPVNQVASSTMLVSVFAVIIGITVLREPVTWQLLVGGGMTLLGVGVILLRSAKKQKAQGTET